MSIQERKLRKVGNSVMIALSKDFLDSVGATVADTVYVDEDKLKEALVKKTQNEEQKKLEMLIAKSMQKHGELYKALVDK
jgi:putative addiction module antidote